MSLCVCDCFRGCHCRSRDHRPSFRFDLSSIQESRDKRVVGYRREGGDEVTVGTLVNVDTSLLR